MKGNYWIQGENLDNVDFMHQCPEDQELSKRDKEQQIDEKLQQQKENHQRNWQAEKLVNQSLNNNNNTNNNNKNKNIYNTAVNESTGIKTNSSKRNNRQHNYRGSRSRQNIEVQQEIEEIGQELERYASDCKLIHNQHETNSIGDFKEELEHQQVPVLEQTKPVKKEENEVNLSFSGCGFLGIYHVGVASCFHQYAPQLSMHKIAGSSAGALVAVAHICGNLQLAYATTDILRVAIDARARALGPFHPSFDIQATVREALDRGLPEDVHLKANGKLHISLTRAYDGENVVVSEFDSKEDVIQALLCSCFIPFWSGWVAPKFRGTSYIDGGFSVNLLILDDKTVSVSPFAGEADICPQDDSLNLLQVSLSNMSFSISPNNLYRLSHALIPPPPEVLSNLCEQGFADGIRFLQNMKLISCTKCLEIRSSLLVTTNGEDMEEAFTQEVLTTSETSNHNNESHIKLEQQEQKTIEINQRRNSVVSTTSQIYQQQQPNQLPSSAPGTSGSSSLLITGGKGRQTSQQLLGKKAGLSSCNECVRIRQTALNNTTLPKQFSDRIRDACDAVNKSLLNWIYSYRPIKYLSYLAAPYYLPLDISLALVIRCWQELPFIRSELLNCIINVIEFIVKVVKKFHTRSTSSLLMDSSSLSSWDIDDENSHLSEYEKKNILRLTTTTTTTTTTTSNNVKSKQHHSTSPSVRAENFQEPSIQVTVAEPVQQFHNHAQPNNPGGIGTNNESSISVRITSDGVCVSKLRNSRSSSSTQLHSLEDTFDSIVDVTSNQEARIFAYYFRDAKNRLQVTEIFDLERAAELQSSSCNSSLNQFQVLPSQNQPSKRNEHSST